MRYVIRFGILFQFAVIAESFRLTSDHEDEIKGNFVWENWSPWTCEPLNSGLYTDCYMSRHRHCSTGKIADCTGSASETNECQELQCSAMSTMAVNCSLHNRTSACEDHAECSHFCDRPEAICDNPHQVAKCPRLCACCNSTTASSATCHANGTSSGLPSTTSSPSGQGTGDTSSTTASPVSPNGNTNASVQTPNTLQSTTSSPSGHGTGDTSSTTASPVSPNGNTNTRVQTPNAMQSTTSSPSGQGTGDTSSTTALPVSPNGNTNTSVQTSNTLQSTTSSASGQGTGDTSSTTISTVSSTSETGSINSPTNVLTSTSKIPYTIPPKTTTCVQCAGPDFLCEKLYEEVDCDFPNNYCINKIVNNKDGTRSVTRGCGNFDTCYKDWFMGTSDIDKCRQFDEDNFLTLHFYCTFCCIENGCNVPLRPDSSTLYKDL